LTSITESSFGKLGLIEPVLRAVRDQGYECPTPIQEKAIPHILEGKDILGCAQTGTGKTAAFALPILHRIFNWRKGVRSKHVIRALVLSPTRELADQIGESFNAYGKHTGIRQCVVFGGVGQRPQTTALRKGVDIVVATPGRLLDLMGQRLVDFSALDIFVLDESDRMLDMGFMPDVRRIVSALPTNRQTLFFSATLTAGIQNIAGNMVREPVRVDVAPPATPIDKIKQVVYHVERQDKLNLLLHLLEDPSISRALIFTRTKYRANRVSRHLENARLRVQAIHGNKTQAARRHALGSFKNGNIRVLVATDIAARGLDVEDISHVFNFDLPNEPEVYVHRIGRTARADASGVAMSFCGIEERLMLSDIQKLIQTNIEVEKEHPFLSRFPAPIVGAHRTAVSQSRIGRSSSSSWRGKPKRRRRH
jgi:ATP-dependent RNA helicase RhlE